MTIGTRISNMRKKRNLTQEELARRVDISRAALSHYEKDRREPDFEVLKKLANFFDVTTDYLISGDTNKDASNNEEREFQAFINDPELRRWYKELPESDEEDLRKLRKMWDIIKSEDENK